MTIHETILKALECYRGDNLYRAKAAFRNYTAKQLDSEYGQSGETPREIMAGYQRHVDRVDAAAEYVRGLAWQDAAATADCQGYDGPIEVQGWPIAKAEMLEDE